MLNAHRTYKRGIANGCRKVLSIDFQKGSHSPTKKEGRTDEVLQGHLQEQERDRCCDLGSVRHEQVGRDQEGQEDGGRSDEHLPDGVRSGTEVPGGRHLPAGSGSELTRRGEESAKVLSSPLLRVPV